MKIKVLVLFAALMLGASYFAFRAWAFWYSTDIVFTHNASVNSDGTVSFSASITDGTNPADCDVFVATGDGHFYNGPLSGLSSFKHPYETAASASYDIELTAKYNGDKDPKRLSGNTPTHGAITFSPASGLSLLSIVPARGVVPGDIATYAVTVFNPCSGNLSGTLNLDYDGSLLVHQDSKPSSGAMSSSLGNAREWAFSGLKPGDKTSFIVQFLTASTATITAPCSVKSRLSALTVAGGGDCRFDDKETNPAPLTLPVAYTHDPNYKIGERTKICQADSDPLKYTVHFQNDGAISPAEIKIEDHLDPRTDFDASFPVLAYCGGHSVNVSPLPYDPATRKVSWTIDPAGKLKGLKDPDYGRTIFDKDTRGMLVFRVKKPVYEPCNAVFNQATIRFDCNPPITTPMLMTPMRCDDCDTCTLVDQIVDTQSDSATVPSAFLATWNSYSAFRWYPFDGFLNSGTVPGPTFLNLEKKQEYALAASKGPANCQRVLYHRFIDPCDGFKIVVHPRSWWETLLGIGKIEAHVEGPGSLADVEWAPCPSQFGPTYLKTGLPAGKHYLGAYDPSSGCTADTEVTINPPFWWVWASLAAAAILFWLVGRRRRQRNDLESA